MCGLLLCVCACVYVCGVSVLRVCVCVCVCVCGCVRAGMSAQTRVRACVYPNTIAIVVIYIAQW